MSRAFTISESIELEILVSEELERIQSRVANLVECGESWDSELVVLLKKDVELYQGLLANITSWRA